MAEKVQPEIEVEDLTIGYGSNVLQQNLNFDVKPGEVFGILGGSGCGKSTLPKHIIGLYEPQKGDIRIEGRSIVSATDTEKLEIMRHFGVTYQGGALFGSMTVAENVALPLQEYTGKSPAEIARKVEEKLKLGDLGGFGDYMPSELSGGMRKRAGLARAMALVFLYYCAFTPLSTLLEHRLADVQGWNGYLVTFLNMVLNFVTEFLYQRFVVYRNSLDTNKFAH